jgi:hypothetical protein
MSEAEKEAGEGFLSRWSRRKREVVETPEAPPVELPVAEPPPSGVPVDQAGPAEQAAPPVERAACPIPEVPEIDPATLPPVESLTVESDFSAFLKPGVPTLLRNAALRRMWSLDPAIRDYIGPVDYQWDFNTPGGLPFGFANELTGDISKLLAQAIGKIEELAEDQPREEEAGNAAESTPALAEEAPPEPEAPPAALVAEPTPAIAPVPEDASSVPVPRRRHGGALPA